MSWIRGVLAALVTCAVFGPIGPVTAAASSEGTEPQIAYSVGVSPIQTDVVTASLDGTVLQRFTNVEPWSSIGRGIAAVTRHVNTYRSKVIGYDASTGDKVFVVHDARLPLFTANGRGLVFQPDNAGTVNEDERDRFVQSVWYRDLASGDEFKLAQFFRPDRYILEKAVSSQGDRVAFTSGNNTFLFEWNVWVVDSDGTGLIQITHDNISNYPSFHPAGQMLAISKQYEGRCRGGLATIGIDGTDENIFFESTCAMDLQRPIWIGAHKVVTVWWRHDARGNRPVGLATVSVPTGEVKPIVEGPIGDIAVSRELGQVAFRFGARLGRVGLYEIETGSVRFLPRTGEEIVRVELDGADEDAV